MIGSLMKDDSKAQLKVEKPFWRVKRMKDMNKREWESLCDNCGKCCCIRLEDEETGNIYITDVACKLFDAEACKCTSYASRSEKVPDCVTLTKDNIDKLHWMPKTCAYRLISEGKELPYYHHLVSGSSSTIHDDGMSVKNAVVSETDVSEDEQIKRIVIWPGEPSA